MADERTRELASPGGVPGSLLQQCSITFVVVGGGAEGSEHPVSSKRVVVGRGGGSDWVFDDDAMSKEHAAIEVGATGVRVVDLGSTNGTYVNGERADRYELKHGDTVQLGEHRFQCLIEARQRGPRTFEIGD